VRTLRWWLLSPLTWGALHDPKALRIQYGGYHKVPYWKLFRLYHPAFWVLFWSLMWEGRRYFQGNLRWLVWCGGGFVELLTTGKLPTDPDERH